MSGLVMGTVLKYSRARGNARMVLLVIGDCCQDDGTAAWPAIETISARAGISERTAQRAIRELVELGELEVAEKEGPPRQTGQRANLYAVRMDRLCGDKLTPLSEGEVSTVTNSGDKSANSGDTAMTPDPSSDPSIDPSSSTLTLSRQEIPAKKAVQQKRATLLPDDFALTEDMKAYAVKNGVDPERVFYEFSKYWRRAERPMKDWGLVWENRVRALFGDPYYALRPTEVKREPLARGEPAVRRVLTDEELKQAEIKERNGGAI